MSTHHLPNAQDPSRSCVEVLRIKFSSGWWTATAEDVPWIYDPADNRHADQDTLDWVGIGTAVTQACALVQNGIGGAVEVELPWAPDSVETGIVRRWFNEEPPTFDIWERDAPDDGRHRLWNAWKANPHVALPVRSTTLADLEAARALPPGPPTADVSRAARYGLRKLKASLKLKNPTHVAALERMAASTVLWTEPDGSVRRLLVRPSDVTERPWRVRVTDTHGDLLRQTDVDALVNPWNRNFVRPRWLLNAGGVSRQLKERTGPAPWRALGRYGVLPVGSAVITGAGELGDDLLLVHAVGLDARWRSSAAYVSAAALSAVEAAWQVGARAIAMPLIGAGHGGLSDTSSLVAIYDALGPYEDERGAAEDIEVRIIINSEGSP